MALLDVVFRLLNKAGTGFVEPRSEIGHGSNSGTPSHVRLPDDQVQTNALTRQQLDSYPVNVIVDIDQPTTPADTQPISADSLPLPLGASTAAKQLPDNHQVTVSNQILQPTTPTDTQPVEVQQLPLPLGAATAAKQLPNNHEVTVSNQLVQPTTPADTQKIADSTDTEWIPVTDTLNAAGDKTIYTPALGKRVRLHWIYAINDPVSETSTKITVKIGTTVYYVAWAISKRQQFTGEIDAPLIINLSANGNVAITAFVEEV